MKITEIEECDEKEMKRSLTKENGNEPVRNEERNLSTSLRNVYEQDDYIKAFDALMEHVSRKKWDEYNIKNKSQDQQ